MPAAMGPGARLTPRLRALAAILPAETCSVADVGAGDGALARHLAERGLRVVATELRPGPFLRLRERAPGLDCRLGDGLEALRPGEVEAVLIAGLGGRTIAAMLERSDAVVRSLRWLVLQPQQHAEALLAWLDAHGFPVERVSTGSERGHPFQVLLVRPPLAGEAARGPRRPLQ
jgi:tRNA (adenine22-N1)-methyltransferase